MSSVVPILREDVDFTFVFGVKIFDCTIVFGFLFVEPRGETGPGVEEVGDEGEVEMWVSGDER